LDSFITCYSAKNGQEGLQKLETGFIPFPSIIFVDLNMPRINGLQMLIQLKNKPDYINILVVIYSTSSNEKDRNELITLGAVNYLVKQSDDAALKADLRKIFFTI
jgi:CheY-like chemotaxis protein